MSSEGAAKEVVERILAWTQGHARQADVADYPDTTGWPRSAQAVRALDILINNAGINSDKTFVKMDHASWRRCWPSTSTVSSTAQGLYRSDAAAGLGPRRNITSVIGQIGNFGQPTMPPPRPGGGHDRSRRQGAGRQGHHHHAVARASSRPRWCRASLRRCRQKLLGQIPMGRFGKADEVSRALRLPCSSDGDYSRGQSSPSTRPVHVGPVRAETVAELVAGEMRAGKEVRGLR